MLLLNTNRSTPVPGKDHFVFTYHISIENNSNYTIKLLRRYWQIFDIGYPMREVEGEGVVGKQPVLEPNQSHQYVSGCNLKSGIGKMMGNYLMERQLDGKIFSAVIPEFVMSVPFRAN